MSKTAQLEAVIAGYREELAVQRLMSEKREAEWVEEAAAHAAQIVQLGREIERLDDENERQEERNLDLEAQVETLTRPMCATPDRMATTAAPEPRVSRLGQQAILAVALMMDNRAQHSAVRVGTDIGDYAHTMERVHALQSEVGYADSATHETARCLYEQLTTAF